MLISRRRSAALLNVSFHHIGHSLEQVSGEDFQVPECCTPQQSVWVFSTYVSIQTAISVVDLEILKGRCNAVN